MFGMGFGELLVVLAIALIFLGPEKIPSTARTLGRWFHEIKSSLDEVKQSFERDLQEKTPSSRKSAEENKQETSSRHLPS
jgi:Tat protein translocase TatB subunit